MGAGTQPRYNRSHLYGFGAGAKNHHYSERGFHQTPIISEQSNIPAASRKAWDLARRIRTMAALNGGRSKPVTSGQQLPYGPVDQYGGASHQATNHDGRGTEHIVRLVVRNLGAGQVGMIFRVHGVCIIRIGWFFLMIDCVHDNPS